MLADSPAFEMSAVQRELNAVREERDLCRALLQADAATLRHFRREVSQAGERLPALLKLPTRETAAFRDKLQRLADELRRLNDLVADLSLPALHEDIAQAQSALESLHAMEAPTGDELLPVIPRIDAVLTTLKVAAPIDAEAPAEELVADDPATQESRQLTRFELALQQLSEQLAREHQKTVQLRIRGAEIIPEDWFHGLFDVSSQLLRNAIEHGIEGPEDRVRLRKPEAGVVEITFAPLHEGFEFRFRDDGQGLDAERILDAGSARGMLGKGAESRDSRRAATLIFKKGLSTATESEGRGNGMSIVREQVHRLGGKIQIATKRGRYTCVTATLPQAPVSAVPADPPTA